MPNATRASGTQKPAGVAVHRAASSSGQSSGTDTDTRPVGDRAHARDSATSRADRHNSSSDSLESGRDRRRRGKLRMQARIDSLNAQLTTANSRISDLEAQNLCLKDLVNELTRRLTTNAGHAPPIVFDIYDTDVTSAACQTDISVKHTEADLFCVVDEAGNYVPFRREAASRALGGHTLAQCTEHTDAAPCIAANTACADAAAGAGHGTPQQAPEVVHARHCGVPCDLGPSKEGFSSQEDFNSHDLAHHCGPLPTSPPHVLFDASAHTCSASKDSKSQDLAVMSRPLLNSPSMPHGANAQTSSAHQDDLNSQDLAVKSGPLPNCPPKVLFNASAHTRDAISEDFNSQDLADQCGPLPNSPPHELLDASAHTGSAISKDFTSQDPGVQSGPLPYSPSVLLGANAQASSAHQEDFNSHDPLVTGQRLALDGDNSEHRCASGNANQGDFNSQDLAKQCGPLPNSPPIVLFDANSQDLAVQSGPLPHSPPALLGANAQTSSPSNELCQSSPWHEVIATTAQLSSCLRSLTVHAACCAHQKDSLPQDQAEQCGPLPISPPIVLFDASAHTRGAISEDFNSHDLAVQCEPLPHSPSVLCGAIAHTCSAKEDYNSQNLAGSQFAATHYRLRDLTSVSQDNLDDRKLSKFHIIPSPPLQDNTLHDEADSQDAALHDNLDDSEFHIITSSPLQEQCGPSPNCPPFVLFDASARSRSANSEDFKSQDLAFQCGPLPNSPKVLLDANAHTCSAKEDFNSQDLAEIVNGDSAGIALQDQRSTLLFGPSERECQRTTGADSVKEEHRNQLSALAASAAPCSKDFKSQEFSASQASAATQCGPLPADFLQTFEGILGIYVKRRKPSSNTTRATARGINFIALKAGVAFHSYSDMLHAKSPLLWQEVHKLSEKLNQS